MVEVRRGGPNGKLPAMNPTPKTATNGPNGGCACVVNPSPPRIQYVVLRIQLRACLLLPAVVHHAQCACTRA
jgi:hypothetical protein